MALSDDILKFYSNISIPAVEQFDIKTLTPFKEKKPFFLMEQFYKKYYGDSNKRMMLVGINPGRFGGGITGIPFTDPVNLEMYCGVENDLDKRHELSSRFMYDMIDAYGGPPSFYSRYYFYSVSPVGFTKDGRNYNYYDDLEVKDYLEDFIVQSFESHFEMGMSREKVFSLGQGKNIRVLEELNKKYSFFKEIIPLPHPRWVMQYRLKKKDEFINTYLEILK